jgi:hypothetical protein
MLDESLLPSKSVSRLCTTGSGRREPNNRCARTMAPCMYHSGLASFLNGTIWDQINNPSSLPSPLPRWDHMDLSKTPPPPASALQLQKLISDQSTNDL